MARPVVQSVDAVDRQPTASLSRGSLAKAAPDRATRIALRKSRNRIFKEQNRPRRGPSH